MLILHIQYCSSGNVDVPVLQTKYLPLLNLGFVIMLDYNHPCRNLEGQRNYRTSGVTYKDIIRSIQTLAS